MACMRDLRRLVLLLLLISNACAGAPVPDPLATEYRTRFQAATKAKQSALFWELAAWLDQHASGAPPLQRANWRHATLDSAVRTQTAELSPDDAKGHLALAARADELLEPFADRYARNAVFAHYLERHPEDQAVYAKGISGLVNSAAFPIDEARSNGLIRVARERKSVGVWLDAAAWHASRPERAYHRAQARRLYCLLEAAALAPTDAKVTGALERAAAEAVAPPGQEPPPAATSGDIPLVDYRPAPTYAEIDLAEAARIQAGGAKYKVVRGADVSYVTSAPAAMLTGPGFVWERRSVPAAEFTGGFIVDTTRDRWAAMRWDPEAKAYAVHTRLDERTSLQKNVARLEELVRNAKSASASQAAAQQATSAPLIERLRTAAGATPTPDSVEKALRELRFHAAELAGLARWAPAWARQVPRLETRIAELKAQLAAPAGAK